MEIVVKPTSQQVTWKIRDFLELPQENDCYLDSPEFIFCGDIYCLRMFPRVNRTDGDKAAYHVRRISDNFRERKVSCKVGRRKRERNGDEGYSYLPVPLGNRVSVPRSTIEENRDELVPDGIFTVLCQLWLSEESTAGSSARGEEEQQGFPGHNVPFSSRWNPPGMELSTESPCTYVYLTVPKFLELSKEVIDSLTSPEFRFAGDTYCFRFHPNGDTADSDLQLVRLTSTFLERTVCYRVGYGNTLYHTYPHNLRSLVGEIGFCLSRSILEEEKEKYVQRGTLRLVLFLCLGERSSAVAGTSDAAQKWIPGIQKLQSDYRQLLQKGTESDACVVVCGKEFPVHRNVLRARSTVFEAMFGHDTAEKESGRVVIEDLDPDSFGDFLDYLYTGDVQDKLSDDNAVGLYVAADKYDVSTLKSECVEHLRRTLTVDSFCDVITLAMRYSDENLKQQSFKFFRDNLKRIIRTEKWQQFMSANTACANELFMKAHEPATQ